MQNQAAHFGSAKDGFYTIKPQENEVMQRREFLKVSAMSLTSQLAGAMAYAASPQPEIKTIYVVSKCHLDLGFTDLEHNVIRTYFERYIPKAIETAIHLENTHAEERYVWTLGSWMVYEYLERASSESRKRMEQAITTGKIAWHAMPFTWESEMLDESLMRVSFGLSKALDRRFGVETIAGKLTDVPGHTRGLIGPSLGAGIQFLDMGSNVHPVDVPPTPSLFNWRNPEGAEIVVLYHPRVYGGIAVLPGTHIAVDIQMRGDNEGPHTISQIQAYYADLRSQFPNATIVATNLNTIAKAVQSIRDRLPVVTQEIGDTWIYGTGSDPGRSSRYRELSRLRLEWLERDAFQFGDPVDLAFSSKLILATEHNGGLDTGAVVSPDVLTGHPEIYTPNELANARRHSPVFQKFDACWAEKRADIDSAINALPLNLRIEAEQRLHSLVPTPPELHRAKPMKTGKEIRTENFVLSLDPKTGAIHRLFEKKSGREWAASTHPLALFLYQTFNAVDFQRYTRQYGPYPDVPWINNVWGKPGLENYPVESRIWEPEVERAQIEETSDSHRIILDMRFSDADAQVEEFVAWPRRTTMELILPRARPEIHAVLQCFEKRANRLPEAMWLSFSPSAPLADGWQLEKVNQYVSPLDVMSNGGRHLHAVTRRVRYHDDHGLLLLETLDAHLVAPGQRLLTDFNNHEPDMREGVHINLYNNLWNTAFPQWYENDMRFRFILSFS